MYHWPRRAILSLIQIYQRTLSPDHSWVKHLFPYSGCRFYPSCSQYAHDSIERHGVVKGSAETLQRLIKCHPGHPGGVDLVK
ncbi:MAG: membrane protein insertion efficiency factor YidD [Patescibacteria group bacterium]